MLSRIGINGFRRVGRMILRAAVVRNQADVLVLNEPDIPHNYMAYLLKHDSAHGVFPYDVRHVQVRLQGGKTTQSFLYVNNLKVRVYSEKDPAQVHWGKEGAEYVAECSHNLLTTQAARTQIKAGGAKRVVIAGMPHDDSVPIFVMGVNHAEYTPDMDVVSTASATTNCVALLAKVIHDNFGIQEGLVTSIHAATATQLVADGPAKPEKSWRAGRAAHLNIIPTPTRSVRAVGNVIKELQGRINGIGYRVPTAIVSVADLTLLLKQPTTYERICDAIRDRSNRKLKVRRE